MSGRSPLSANYSTRVNVDGKEYLYFGGTNYLSLAQRPELMQAANDAFGKYGFSSGASRLTSGENDLLLELEHDMERFAGAGGACVLPAGFLSNQMVVEALDDQVDVWVVDRRAHASVHAAVRQSSHPVMLTDIADGAPDSYREALSLTGQQRIAVFAEPIDPLTGRLLDVPGCFRRIAQHDFLVLDEAHSFGVLGKQGRGALEHWNMRPDDRIVRTGTFSKALGSYGGFVLGASTIMPAARKKSRVFQGSTSLPPPVIGAALAALKLLISDPSSTIARLHENVGYLCTRLKELGLPEFSNDGVPIFYLAGANMSAAPAQLKESAIFVPAAGGYFGSSDMLRWTIQAGHTESELRNLVAAIGRALANTDRTR